ncbi:hypothetical protein D3C71_1140180 [compost metagenome]
MRRQGRVADLQRKLDPLVVGQLQQPRCIGVGRCGVEEVDELLADLGEQRRMRAVIAAEGAHLLTPTRVTERALDHREVGGQQTLDVVEVQLAVDLHPRVRNLPRCGVVLRVAQVRGEACL